MKLFAAALLVVSPMGARADCSLTSVGITPLSDSAAEWYRGHRGGLYPGGSSTRPPRHERRGIEIGQEIEPLDRTGLADANRGRIVMISLGMSNSRYEFGQFVRQVGADASINPRLTIVNGAQDSQTADVWSNPQSHVWGVLDRRLTSADVTPAQVQVAWIKLAQAHPLQHGGFPEHAERLRDNIARVVRRLVTRYPNLRLAYLSSRTRAYIDDASSLNPEPYAFETGLSVRWLIGRQLAGAADLNFDSASGSVVAPYLSWGPYLWADGLGPRSDGLVWRCNDLSTDFTHPSNNGLVKVSDQLIAFFKTDPTSTPWFLKGGSSGDPPVCAFATQVSRGSAPSIVRFTDGSRDPDGSIVQHARTFGDGTSSLRIDPVKVYSANGSYPTRLTVTDDDGNSATCTSVITLPEPGGAASMLLLGGLLHCLVRRRCSSPAMEHDLRSG